VDAAASSRGEIAGRASLVSDRTARRRTTPKPGEAFWRRRVVADGKAVWSWHPLLVSSWRRQSEPNRVSMRPQSVGDGDKTNSSPGRARNKPLKPLRRECRCSGEPVVTTVCFLPFAHGLRVQRAPGISLRPHFLARMPLHHSGASRREAVKLRLQPKPSLLLPVPVIPVARCNSPRLLGKREPLCHNMAQQHVARAGSSLESACAPRKAGGFSCPIFACSPPVWNFRKGRS
jgi:hypothetical protein